MRNEIEKEKNGNKKKNGQYFVSQISINNACGEIFISNFHSILMLYGRHGNLDQILVNIPKKPYSSDHT